jgi:inhibitor of KinA sporulation pathway (predicted exonuclease)
LIYKISKVGGDLLTISLGKQEFTVSYEGFAFWEKYLAAGNIIHARLNGRSDKLVSLTGIYDKKGAELFNRRKFYTYRTKYSNLRDLLGAGRPLLFFDIECTIGQIRTTGFNCEMFQFSYILLDAGLNVAEQKTYNINPDIFGFNSTTKRFFSRTKHYLLTPKISFDKVWNELDQIRQEHNPVFLSWSKADCAYLTNNCIMYNLPDITKRFDFCDFLIIYKNFFNLHSDIGLFNAFYEEDVQYITQSHDSMEDCLVMHKLFLRLIRKHRAQNIDSN